MDGPTIRKSPLLVGAVFYLMLLLVSCGQGLDATPTAANGGLEGAVSDANGLPVSGMRIAIVEGTTAFPEIAPETNENGGYEFPSLQPGTFEVAVHDKEGNRTVQRSVEVRSGETSRMDFNEVCT